MVLLSRPPRRNRRPNGPPPKSCSAVNRSCAANHVTAAPARPHSFVQCSMVLLSRPPRRNRRLNGRSGVRYPRSSRAVVSTPRSSRAVVSTGRAPRTTSPQCARTASCSEASFRCLGRRGGTEGLTATVSGSVAQCCQHPDLVAQCCQPVVRGEPPHASAPAPLRAVKHRSAVSAAAAEPKA